jgi:hypothetical protein
MRELIRAITQDGNLSDEDRIVFQNVAVLLSQVDGKTWVNFPDSDGELRELTDAQLKTVRPFLAKVADELKASQTELESQQSTAREIESKQVDVLRLVDVEWADGITARELLTCCGPDDALQVSGRWSWLDQATKTLPTAYMLRSRVRELINYYALLQIQAETSPESARRKSLSQRVAAFGCLGQCCSRVARLVSASLHFASTCIVQLFRRTMWLLLFITRPLSQAVLMVVAAIVNGILWLYGAIVPPSSGPLWPAVRLFGIAILMSHLHKLLDIVVLMLRLRVLLCLGSCNQVMGRLLYPITFVAEKVLGWNARSKVSGCSCNGVEGHSLLSWFPARIADGLIWVLQHDVVEVIPMPYVLVQHLSQILGVLHPILTVIFDLAFSMSIASGLQLAMKQAEHQAKPKLVWMSMNLSRMLRDGPTSFQHDETKGRQPALASLRSPEAMRSIACMDPAAGCTSLADEPDAQMAEPPPLPEWQDDGTWNLFE